MAESVDREEQYLLRVQDKAVAAKIEQLLTQPLGDEKKEVAPIELRFSTREGKDSQAREGTLTIDGEAHPVKRQDFPSIVESYKTYDDITLVKTADVGQVILLPAKGRELPEGTEARHGVTPPLRDARKHRFRTPAGVDPKLIREVEDTILQIASGSAPMGYEFVDEEEEYVVGPDGRGSWQPYKPGTNATPQATGPPQKKAPAKRKSKKKEAAQAAADGTAAMDTEDI